MNMRDSSLEAYRSLEGAGALQEQERKLMRLIHRNYPLPARFTRKELAAVTGWGINVVTGRCHSLVAKGWLTDYEKTRDGGHLLSISQTRTATPLPENSARPEKSSGLAAVAGYEVKSQLDDLKPGDFIMSFGELCQVVVAPGMVDMHYRTKEGKPAQTRYEAMTVRPVRGQRRAT